MRQPALLLMVSAAASAAPWAAGGADNRSNFVFVLTDDQDLRLGSLQAMPYLRETVLPESANLSNYMVHTPICCPSRSTLITGRFVHNIKSSSASAPGCMHMNSSYAANPQFWDQGFFSVLQAAGYATGVFGKLLNNMSEYGCDGAASFAQTGLHRGNIMCNPAFYHETWADFTRSGGAVNGSVHTDGAAPSDYTTSVVGNSSVLWLKQLLALDPAARPPFFAFIGPHAPHLPSTPPPYAVDPAIAQIPVPVDPIWNVTSRTKHSFLATEPEINAADLHAIQAEHTNRLQSLVAVDNVVEALVELLKNAGVWDNTYFFYTSDHGYSLGQNRVDSHKTQVYDHNLRVPMILHGPGVAPGSEFPLVTSMVDLAPTIVDLAVGSRAVPALMDGSSFASLIAPGRRRVAAEHDRTRASPSSTPVAAASAAATATAAPDSWKTVALVEYMSIRDTNVGAAAGCDLAQEVATAATPAARAEAEAHLADYLSAYGYRAVGGRMDLCASAPPGGRNTHFHDGPNNTFAALRVVDAAAGHDLLYAEFVDGFDPLAWDFAPDRLNFHELYNVTNDYYMAHNIYAEAPQQLKDALHVQLQAALKCKGRAACDALLKFPQPAN